MFEKQRIERLSKANEELRAMLKEYRLRETELEKKEKRLDKMIRAYEATKAQYEKALNDVKAVSDEYNRLRKEMAIIKSELTRAYDKRQ